MIRTTAIEGKGIGELAEAIERFREQRERSGEQRAKIVEYWKQRLVLLMETQVMARALNGDGRRALESLALEVAERRKNPYTAVRELLSRAGLETPRGVSCASRGPANLRRRCHPEPAQRERDLLFARGEEQSRFLVARAGVLGMTDIGCRTNT